MTCETTGLARLSRDRLNAVAAQHCPQPEDAPTSATAQVAGSGRTQTVRLGSFGRRLCDKVILQSEGDDVVGVTSFTNTNANGYGGYGAFHGNAYSSGVSRQVKKHDVRYIVVKYLPDQAPEHPAPEDSAVPPK